MSLFRVKILSVLLLAGAAIVLSGCESGSKMPSVFRERFAPTYHTHSVAAEQKATYEAAREAVRQLGYSFVRGGAAQGELEALSTLQPGSGARSARQVSIKMKLAPATGGGTEVSVLFSEIREDDFSKREGMGTTTAMSESGLYAVFFSKLDAALAQPKE